MSWVGDNVAFALGVKEAVGGGKHFNMSCLDLGVGSEVEGAEDAVDGVADMLEFVVQICYRLFCDRKTYRIGIVGIFYNRSDWHRKTRPNCRASVVGLRRGRSEGGRLYLLPR